MNPIGLILPIKRGNLGYFAQSYDTITQIKSNIINLMRTNSGERRMQPNFSGGIQELLFEQNSANTPEILKKIISDKIQTWIPGVNIVNIDLNYSTDQKNKDVDIYTVYLQIIFSVSEQVETIDLEFTSNNI